MTKPRLIHENFERWAEGLRFGPYVEDETVTQVREIAKNAFEAGFRAGGAARTKDSADKAG